MTKRKRPTLEAHDSAGNRYPLVHIDWVDSSRETVWTYASPNDEVSHCRSVGWVILETKEAIVIAGNIADQNNGSLQRCGAMTIPKCAIKKIRRVTG